MTVPPRLWQESTGGLLEAPLFASDRVQAEKSKITPLFGAHCSDASTTVSAARRRKTPGSLVPFDPECCYLYVDGSYEPAAVDSPEKCG